MLGRWIPWGSQGTSTVSWDFHFRYFQLVWSDSYEELGESGDEATVEEDEDEEADIVGEEELGSLSLEGIVRM